MTALANAAPSVTQAQLDAYVEEVCRFIHQSSAVQEARVQAYLDGALLAAEQVQDVRIAVVEQPAELSGWQFWMDIAITFCLESNLVGALLKAAATKVFTPLVRSNAVWLRIPKSPTGEELVAIAKRARTGLLIEPGKGRLTFEGVLERGVGGLPGRASKDSIRLYHAAIQELPRLVEPLDIAQGVAQAANQARQSGLPRERDPLATTDSPGVFVLAAAQQYARNTILGIQVRAARFEAFARTRAAVPDLGDLAVGMLYEDLNVSGQQVSLEVIRRRCALLFEALIWARMYGFSLVDPSIAGRAGRGTPQLGTDDEEPLKGVRKELVEYWLDRFRLSLNEFAKRTYGVDPPSKGNLGRSVFLRAYFAALSRDLEKTAAPGRDELAPLKPL